MRRARPDLEIVPFRGNVDTRLRKLADGIADATLLAVAGLNRLGRQGEITSYLDAELYPPAPAQGAIGIEIRGRDTRTAELVAALDHHDTHVAVGAERAFLRELDGSCRTAIGVHSRMAEKTLALTGEILSPDGKLAFRDTVSGPAQGAEALGRELGQILRHKAGSDFLKLFPA
jgi:hydroxymethylbilane synthase